MQVLFKFYKAQTKKIRSYAAFERYTCTFQQSKGTLECHQNYAISEGQHHSHN